MKRASVRRISLRGPSDSIRLIAHLPLFWAKGVRQRTPTFHFAKYTSSPFRAITYARFHPGPIYGYFEPTALCAPFIEPPIFSPHPPPSSQLRFAPRHPAFSTPHSHLRHPPSHMRRPSPPMLNFHAILYDFFIEGLELDTIAAKHETSWREVTEIVSSEPAMQTMRAAIRAERLRDIAQNLASRRAADAILRGTTPRGRTSRAARPAARPTTRPTAHPEPVTPSPITQVLTPASESPKQTERTRREPPRKPVSLPAKSPRQSIQVARTPVRTPDRKPVRKPVPKARPSPSARPKPSAPSNRRGDNSS